MTETITIFLADDHQMFREGLHVLLEFESDLRVIGEASDGLEAARLTTQLMPDILLADLMMPGLDGLHLAREVQRRAPKTRVIIVSMYGSEAHVVQAMRYGIMGYVLKDTGVSEVVRAVREVRAGRLYLCQSISRLARGAYRKRVGTASSDTFEMLTGREREVLILTAQGYTTTEIGILLGISHRTVEIYRLNMKGKLGLRTRSDVFRYAINRGLLPMNDGPSPMET